MYKYLLPFAFILLNINCHAQDLKKTINRKNNGLVETFYVLKSDKSTKHGEYLLSLNEQIIQKGAYTNNIKSGDWEYFFGRDIEFIYNFDSCMVVSDTIGKERGAVYSEGYFCFQYFMYSYVDYPDEARDAGIQGSVVIEFTVDTDGIPKQFSLKASCGNVALNDEAMRVVKKTSLDHPWYPAINKRGEKVKSVIEREVNFIIKTN